MSSVDTLHEMDYTTYIDFDLDSTKPTFENGVSKPPKPVRKKFAVPPVKVACLEWYGLFQCSVHRQVLTPAIVAEHPERDAMANRNAQM